MDVELALQCCHGSSVAEPPAYMNSRTHAEIPKEKTTLSPVSAHSFEMSYIEIVLVDSPICLE